MSKEDYQASQKRSVQASKPPIGRPPSGPPSVKNIHPNVHQANANATFNSFIDENTPQWQNDIASAYSQVNK
jgi:hypothetical protein